MKGITFSLLSGLLAATASVCGKFSMAAEKTLLFCESLLENINHGDSNKPVYSYTPICQSALLWVRGCSLLGMLLLNGLMWTLFTKALRLSPTALAPTLANTAANFLATAVYGSVLFGERLSLTWWCGATLVVLGLALMHSPAPNKKDD